MQAQPNPSREQSAGGRYTCVDDSFFACVPPKQPDGMKALRAILGRRTSFGSLTGVWGCGIIFGIEPLLESEGCEEVVAALERFFPDENRRPTVLFYDKACVLDRYLAGRGETSWRDTLFIVDRQVALQLLIGSLRLA